MKKIFLLLFLAPALLCFAQTNPKIILTKSQKITALSNSSMEADMGMGMQMKNISTATNILTVLSEDDKNYNVLNTLTQLSLSINAMGQETSYDSDKPADKDSDLGKELSAKINKADTLKINKISGDVSKINKSPERPEKTDESNPLAGMLGSMGGDVNSDMILDGAFFLIPDGKRNGDSWTDSTTEKTMKTVKKYTVKSIEKNIATIIVTGSITGHGETEMQGSTLPFDMNTINNAEIIVNILTGLVSKISSTADITMTMEVMGQTMPVTSKANSTVTYQ